MKRVFFVSLALLVALSFTACSPIDYQKAAKILASGDYETARPLFETLGDYKNSADLLKECDYLKAKDLAAEQEFEAAADLFALLGDYKDSADLQKENTYLFGKKQLEDKAYEDAMETLQALADYKDSEALASSAKDELIREKLVGEWISSELDTTTPFMNRMKEDGAVDDSVLPYFDGFHLLMQYTLTFTDKGTMEQGVDKELLEKSWTDLKERFVKALLGAYEEQLTSELAASGISLREALDYYGVKELKDLFQIGAGYTPEEYVDEYIGATEDTFGDKTVGTFSVQDGEFSLHYGTKSMYGTIDLATNKLTIIGGDSEDMMEEMGYLYPMTFTKITE